MSATSSSLLAGTLAMGLRAHSAVLTGQWLDRLQAHASGEENRMLPVAGLLEHGPSLLEGIATFVEQPAAAGPPDVPLLALASRLVALRLRDGADADQILKEYELLGSLLYEFTAAVADQGDEPCTPHDLLVCAHRLFRAISLIEQLMAAEHLRALGRRVDERDERLRRFGRLVTHDLKNRVGAVIGAGQLLQEEWVGGDDRERFASMVVTNAESIRSVVDKLATITRMDGDDPPDERVNVSGREA